MSTMNEASKCLLSSCVSSAGTAAMLLALTRSITEEDFVKNMVAKKGYRYVVTEVGGRSTVAEFQERTTKAVIGACLNSGMVKKTTPNIHALLHALEEAKRGVLVNASSSTSLAMKIAIVRDHQWVAVAMFGDSAIHPMTNHERAGMGVMHLSDSSDPIVESPELAKWSATLTETERAKKS